MSRLKPGETRVEGRTSIDVQFMFVDLRIGAKDQSSPVIAGSQRSGHRPA